MSVGCALAGNIYLFLVFRLLQGAAIAGSALAGAVVRDTTDDPQQAASRIGYITMAMAVAPMLGPMIGGVIDSYLGWRAIFWLYAILGAALYLLVWSDLGETNHHRSATFRAQIGTYPDLFKSRRFWGYALCMAFSVSGFYAYLAGAPLVAERQFAMNSAEIGIYLGLITLGFFCGTFLSGRYAARFQLTSMMIAGRLAAAAGMLTGIAVFALGYLDMRILVAAAICYGFGNGLTMPSANAGALSVRPKLAGSAGGLAGALTVGGGGIVTWLTGAIVAGFGGVYPLLIIMLTVALLGLGAALMVRAIDKQEAT